jgi:hypothetical protein
MRRTIFLAAAAITLASPAWAVFKCKNADGRTTFQERPCEATGTTGHEIQTTPATGNNVPTQTYTAKTSDEMRKENRLLLLNNTEITRARNEIKGASAKCDREMREVASRKSYANNNLAGATWEQSLSTEMQAIATRCGAEQTRLNNALDRLLSEKQQLEKELQK